MIDTNERITHVFKRIATQVEDREKTRKDKVRFQFYFDTHDVRVAIFGLAEYADRPSGPSSFELNRNRLANFNTPNTDVTCLLSAGLLGRFRMLAPHQSELLGQLKKDVLTRKFSDENRIEFSNLVGVQLGGISTEEWDEADSKTKRKLIENEANRAKTFFNAYQTLRQSAGERLRFLRDSSLLDTSVDAFNYSQLISSDQFIAIRKSFDSLKGRGARKSRNSFADAVAMSMLIKLAEDFNSGRTLVASRFYDSSGSFRRVADASGVAKLLELNGLTRGVLMDAEYFVDKATFANYDTDTPKSTLAVLHEELSIVQDPTGGLKKKERALDEVEVNGRILREVVDDLFELSYLQNVWVSKLTEWQVRGMRDHFTMSYQLPDEIKESVNLEIDRVSKELEENVDEYKRLANRWLELENGVLNLRSRFGPKFQMMNRRFNVVRDLELIRFGLSESAESQLNDAIFELLDSESEVDLISTSTAWQKLVRIYIYEPSINSDTEVVSAVLWAMESYSSITKLLAESKLDIQSPLGRMYAAACLEDVATYDEGSRFLTHSVSHFDAYDETAKPDAQAIMARCNQASFIAYLWFHCAKARNYTPLWQNKEHRQRDHAPIQYVARALEYAKKACDLVLRMQELADSGDTSVKSEWVDLKLAYIMNQKLYYLTELGSEQTVKEMDKLARTLVGYSSRQQSHLWQYTFDDTLARYFHFLAVTVESERSKTECINSALQLAKKAVDAAPWSQLAAANLHQIQITQKNLGRSDEIDSKRTLSSN